MQLSTEHILTTYAGSLPRPDDVARMLYDLLDDKPVDQAALDARVRSAIAEVVERQQKIGIDVISDGELGKVGFSNYVLQRMSGFEGKADFMAADFADAPGVAQDAFGSEGSLHLRLPVLNGPIEVRDTNAVDKEISDFKSALGNTSPDNAFIPAVTPGQIAFNFPNRYYKSHQQYIEAAAAALAPEYNAIVKAGFNLQLDSPDAAMAFHCSTQGSDLADPAAHLAAGIEVLNDVLSGVPAEKDLLPRLLGKLSRAAPQGRRPKGHRQPYPQVASEVHLPRSRESAPRTRVGRLEGREAAGRQGAYRRGDRHQDQQCRASRAGRGTARAIRQYRRQGARHRRHRLRLRYLRRLPSLPSRRGVAEAAGARRGRATRLPAPVVTSLAE